MAKKKFKVDCNELCSAKKHNISSRLNRIEGQIRGIEKMVHTDRSSMELLHQITSVEKAIDGVKKVILRNYLETCATQAIKSDDDEVYDALMDIIYKYS